MSVSAGFESRPIPAIVGATAIGKTAVALELAEDFGLEIVSCDSRQIYKYLNIGTAKPLAHELRGIPYHLIDLLEPDRLFSAARYRAEADQTIADVFKRRKMPLVVGGTGLYLKALMSGFFITPDADLSYRDLLSRLSSGELHARLEAIDPQSAAEIPQKNRQRVIRALEIVATTGKTKSELKLAGRYPPQRWNFVVFWLTCDRQKLYQLIDLRVDKMIRDGLVAEVETLVQMGYRQSPVLASTVGYREVLEHLEGRYDLERCRELIKQRTRNYAKRQVTWFKRCECDVTLDTGGEGWHAFLFQRVSKLKLDR